MSSTDESTSTAVAERPAGEWLAEALEIDNINAQRLALIKNTVAKDANVAEVGMFLELAAKYELDPFAKEIWCAKGKGKNGQPGKLLIMVGRDGLRRIATRNGLEVKGDVVRENDEYEVEFITSPHDARPGEWEANGSAEFHRVTHKHVGLGKKRGDVVGSWSRVVDKATRTERGWFEAEVDEYKPANASSYSPWENQEGAMMLAAAERQAVRQATPLSGLLVEGEADRNLQLEAGEAIDADPGALSEAVEACVPAALAERALSLMLTMNGLAPGSWAPGKVEMVFTGKAYREAKIEIEQIERQIEELRARPAEDAEEEHIEDAHVVDETPNADARAELEQLALREADLEREAAEDEPGSRAQEEHGQELEQVRERIRELGGTPAVDRGGAGDGQDALL